MRGFKPDNNLDVLQCNFCNTWVHKRAEILAFRGKTPGHLICEKCVRESLEIIEANNSIEGKICSKQKEIVELENKLS